MSKRLSDQEKQLLDYLHWDVGMSGRAISKTLRMPKSTVNDYLARSKGNEVPVPEGAKILVFDIETAPAVGYFWGRWQENLYQSKVIQEGFMLTWSARWLGTDDIICDSIHFHTDEIKPENDKCIVDSLWRLIDEADVLVAHNGDGFDETTFNARAVYHGKQPPHPAKMVDTLKVAKNRFRFPSNALDSLAEYLGIAERKLPTDFSLWERCMRGEQAAFEEMLEYNIQDVAVLEPVYLKLRPWDRRHPNVALIEGEVDHMRCGVCGSSDLQSTGRHVVTTVSKFPTYRCRGCGAVKRTGQTVLSQDERKQLLRNVAK